MWMDKTLICPVKRRCLSTPSVEAASDSCSVHFSSREWTNPLGTAWPTSAQLYKWSCLLAWCPAPQLSNPLAAQQMGDGTCVTEPCTDRDRCKRRHKRTTTSISSQEREWRTGVVSDNKLFFFPQLRGLLDLLRLPDIYQGGSSGCGAKLTGRPESCPVCPEAHLTALGLGQRGPKANT